MRNFTNFIVLFSKVVFYVFSFYAFYWIFGPKVDFWWIVVYCLFVVCGDMGLGKALQSNESGGQHGRR